VISVHSDISDSCGGKAKHHSSTFMKLWRKLLAQYTCRDLPI